MAKKYVNENNLQITMTEYQEDLRIKSKIRTQYGKEVGTITQVYDNTSGAGEQVYAVVPNPEQDASQVQEVTVLFRGSTGPDEVFQKSADVWNDWIENDVPLGLRINAKGHPNFVGDHDRSTKQLKAASEALNDIMAKYPNAKFKIYGHSLGSMDAQYAIANLSEEEVWRIVSAHIYNAPNIYGLLDNKQKKTVDIIKGRIYNYADPKDKISMVGRRIDQGSMDSVGMVYYLDSKKKGFTDQHMTYGYQLDADGKLKVLKTLETGPVNQVFVGMQEFQQYKSALARGGFSSTERLFLDGEQARVVASGFSAVAEMAHEKIEQETQETKTKAEELYRSLADVPWGFFYLSSSDVQAAYANGGVDYSTTVGEIEEYCQKKRNKSTEILASSKALTKELLSGIDRIEERDQILSGIFGR